MIKVQTELRKVSDGVLDTDFIKMQSIVIADPEDPKLLIVVINVAALSRREMELVELVPVPSYEKNIVLVPVLNYKIILLDQLSQTYSILTEQEEHDCITSRCYTHDEKEPFLGVLVVSLSSLINT